MNTEIYNQYVDLYEVYKTRKKQDPIVFSESGFDGGFSIASGINIIGGISSHGKSTLAYSIAFQTLLKGKNVVFITLEIPKADVFYHMLSIFSYYKYLKHDCDILEILHGNESGILNKDMLEGNLRDEHEKYTFEVLWNEFKQLNGQLYVLSAEEFNTTSPESLKDRLITIETMAKEKTGKGVELVIVDYIQLFKNYDKTSNEYEAYSNWVNYYLSLSNNYLVANNSIPIVLLSQVNRDAWKKQTRAAENETYNKSVPPTARKKSTEIVFGMSEIAGSLEIAKAATKVFLIYADENLKLSKQCKVFQLKNRNGRSSETPLTMSMIPEYSFAGEFTDLEKHSSFDGRLEDIIGPSKDIVFNLDVELGLT